MKTFTRHEQLWTAKGDLVVYVCEDWGQHIVRDVLTHHPDEEPSFGDPYPIMENQLFTEEPTVEVSPEANRLAVSIAQMKTERDSLQKEVSKLHSDKSAIENKIANVGIHWDIACAIDLVEGRITHFVEHGNKYWGPYIKNIEAISSGSWDDQYRAVYLSFNKSDKKFNWVAHQGRGSDYDHQVTPCKSYEEAKEVAQKIFKPEFARAKHQSSLESVDKLIRQADLIGMVIPEDVAEHREKLRQAEAEKERLKNQAQLEELQKKLGVA